MDEPGWSFDTDFPATTGDPVFGARFAHEIYTRADPGYTGIFNSAFKGLTDNEADYYPPALREEIDVLNQRIYDNLNNGVYRAGFATTQHAYEDGFEAVFDTLDWLENHLATRTFLVGDQPTAADWRLFTILVRFDAVYYSHFKCNRQWLIDFPRLWAYVRRLHAIPGVAETLRLDHIKHHYYRSHPSINPTRIIPRGSDITFD